MTINLLKKGLEIELYGGKDSGEVIPLSKKLQKHFSFISQEPDQRNFEYITKPCRDYNDLFSEIIKPKLQIRRYLKEEGDLTLIPGSTMPLPFAKNFYYSKASDPYHQFILKTYKTKVITTSVHINIGISNYEKLFKLLCALRLDTPLFLALSASSPFHDGKLTSYESYRWHSFPKTPGFVPLFKTHDEFIAWTNNQLKTKKMFNTRHLWTSIRPNGPNRPHKLNRIEIRICDLVSDTKMLLAIVALIECICQKYLYDECWPEILNQKKSKLNKLVKTMDKQEELAAHYGLDAKIWDWRNDTELEAYKIIENSYKKLKPLAEKIGILKHLNNIFEILENGNEASRFTRMYKKNNSISKTMQHFVRHFTNLDLKYSKIIRTA